LVMLKPWLTPPEVLGALVVYRAIYYLLPLGVAVVALGAYEIAVRREQFSRAVRVAGRWVPRVAPHVLSLTTFAAGVVLLVSGATPSIHTRVVSLHQLVP